MTKRTGIFDVNVNNSLIQLSNTNNQPLPEIQPRPFTHYSQPQQNVQNIPVKSALKVITQQMLLNGMRERTITDYNYQFNKFVTDVKITYLHEITKEKIYEWLSMMNSVSQVTKLNRLKTIKAILGKCFENGWYHFNFWKTIQIKVDKKIKKGANENDLSVLLSLLDTSTFVGFRDTVAILVLYRCGIRSNTLGLLEEKHLDFTTNTLFLSGDIMKSHKSLKLPIDEQLSELLKQLLKQNEIIKKHYKQNNNYVFITSTGRTINGKSPSNSIAKQLYKYAKKYELKNISSHAIRRSYAKSLLNKGASVAVISKALGHSDLAVTTQYLDLDVEEVSDTLRSFL
ncbi:tyrosine-type recombinase/integrase [Psychrobacillus sp. NPDC096426]|uniref:tyrosine-type recombinase/integrase n=1 Tax=Psychrobacillus sp. NPDC096426 TaxID=3364491 RepID=UPI003815D48F